MGPSAALGRPTRLVEHVRWRPDWAPDRVDLWWYLTLREHPQVAASSRSATRALQTSPHVDANPVAWLHLTLREIGFADEVTPEAVRECVARTRRALAAWKPLTLRVGTVGALPSAVVLWAEPRDAVEDLRAALTGRTEPITDRDGLLGPDAQWPHVSIAYVRHDCDPEQVLSHLPAVAPVQISISEVTLAAVTRHDTHYEWTVQAHVPLGAIVGSAPPELGA
jgi:2'-5' RNA ligase